MTDCLKNIEGREFILNRQLQSVAGLSQWNKDIL